ncbi:MAG: phosphatase PAP2 family protein [Methanobrevibacter sp.]|nr:phosphatase PAP2 family protein [Methanobrevibacter sp.]
MPFITHLGGFKALFAICIAIIVLASIFKKRNVRNIAILCLLSLLIADGIALVLKILFMEPRPFVALSDVHLLITENDPNSFPSGHTTSTVAVLGFLIFRYKNKLLRAALIVCCFLIGFSRIYCGVHYPFDVIAGAILGTLSAYFVYRYGDEILVRLGVEK